MTENKAVSCYLMGGLGNQLFQIFTAISYGISNQRKIVLPYTETLTTGKERPTYWNSFLRNLVIFTTRVNKNYSLQRFLTYNERDFQYVEIPPFNQPEIMLFGYFQSYLYFEKDRDALLSMIQLPIQKNNIRQEYSGLFSYNNDITRVISMHFRLGDYKLNPACHPIMPFEYYHNALASIISNQNNDTHAYKVLYFCEKEDNEYVSTTIQKLSILFPSVYFEKVDDEIPDWKQMLLMSCCHDNIIANSSFSWWGGYFNDTPDKIVCYPSVWFGPGLQKNVTDLFPQKWTKILW